MEVLQTSALPLGDGAVEGILSRKRRRINHFGGMAQGVEKVGQRSFLLILANAATSPSGKWDFGLLFARYAWPRGPGLPAVCAPSSPKAFDNDVPPLNRSRGPPRGSR
jgi:hypothetical protein